MDGSDCLRFGAGLYPDADRIADRVAAKKGGLHGLIKRFKIKVGGHPDDLPVSRPRYHAMKGFVSLKEMMDEMRIELGLATGHGAARG